jgi:hypothetical protein
MLYPIDLNQSKGKKNSMKLTIAKFLLPSTLLTVLVGTFAANAFASGGPAPLPQNPPVVITAR